MPSPLEIYDLYGFKFFPCNANKTPATKGDWKDPKNHIDKNTAERLQSTGEMIGAWIPENVIVIDLDRHDGKKSGYAVFNEIVKKYNVPLKIGDTFAVQTAGKGLHMFFTCDNEYRQNTKAESVDLKTNKGYVIAAGSPGYQVSWDCEIMPIPFELEQWLIDCEKKPDQPAAKENKKSDKKTKKLSVQNLRKILDKIPATAFRNNDKWIEFIFSAVATCGESDEVYQALTEWSMTDPEYKSEERNVARRIKASYEEGGITSGTFIHILRDHNLSDKIINNVLKSIAVSEVLIISEQNEKNLPFPEPDYFKLSELPYTAEFFNFPAANTAAASILEEALKGSVIFVYSEDKK